MWSIYCQYNTGCSQLRTCMHKPALCCRGCDSGNVNLSQHEMNTTYRTFLQECNMYAVQASSKLMVDWASAFANPSFCRAFRIKVV